MRKWKVLGLAGAVVALGAAAFVWTREDQETRPVTEVVGADTVLPDSGLIDWVSYGDEVAVVYVLSEAEITPPAEVVERGEGYIGRTVDVRIERSLWVAVGHSPLEGRVQLVDWGWHLKDGEKRPFAGRLEVGGRYVVPLADINGKVGSMALTAIPVEDGKVSESVDLSRRWYRALAGLSLDELANHLATTAPDPLAEQLRHLPAVERAEAVRAARSSR